MIINSIERIELVVQISYKSELAKLQALRRIGSMLKGQQTSNINTHAMVTSFKLIKK